MTSVIFGTEASITAQLDRTACAVRAIWGMVDRGCLALRASAPPATAIGPLRGRSGLQRALQHEKLYKLYETA
jgi:hypothetical protein